jgi:hypothetical protein
MNAEQPVVEQHSTGSGDQHLHVTVVTTSGTYPKDGTDGVPANQPVRVELHKAQKELEIADTAGWIVTVGGTEIDPNKSYADNGLGGEIKLDWGPREGGGGKGVGRNA